MMRLHKIILPLVLILLCARTASAAENMKVGFMIDFINGISVPISDSTYKNYADVSFKTGVRAGVVLYLLRNFGIAPEGEFDFIPVNSDDNLFENNNIDARFYRVRGLIGGRFIIPFGIGSFYLRTMFGIDHITGSTTVRAGGFSASSDWSSTGFTFEPGLGIQFNVVRHIVLGFSTGFPIALHDFGSNNQASRLLGVNNFTAVDVDFLAVFGFRL